MRGKFCNTLIVLLTFGLFCSCRTSTNAIAVDLPKEPESSKESVDHFWRKFQSALARNNVAGITRLTRFPIDCSLGDLDDFEGIRNREGFVRHFTTLFRNETIRTLLDTKTLTRDEGDAETWTVSHDEPTEISEMEWSIIYRFSRLPDGSIKLTAIQFAG